MASLTVIGIEEWHDKTNFRGSVDRMCPKHKGTTIYRETKSSYQGFGNPDECRPSHTDVCNERQTVLTTTRIFKGGGVVACSKVALAQTEA